MVSMNYFDSDMYNSTNTVVCFDGKDGNLYIHLRTMSHTIYAVKFEQTIIHQHVLIDGASVTIILCLHVLFAHRIFIDFRYVDYFQ